MRSGGQVALACALAGAPLCSCINEDVTLYEVRVTGEVSVDPAYSSEGTLHLALYFADVGSGELAFTVDPIESRELSAPGAVDEQFLIPLDERRGLLVYGWLDLDGDGLLCAVGAADEPAGLVEVGDYTDHKVSFTLQLDQPCTGAEALYP